MVPVHNLPLDDEARQDWHNKNQLVLSKVSIPGVVIGDVIEDEATYADVADVIGK